MRWIRTVSLLMAVAGTQTVFGQIDAKGLEQALKVKPQWQLRNFSAESVARYKWVDGKLVGDPVQVHIFGVFTVESVKLKGDKLTIKGNRSAVVRDSKTGKFLGSGRSPMTLEIVTSGAPVPMKGDDLADALFFPDLQSAAAAVPDRLKKVLGLNVTEAAKCDCIRFFDDDGQWIEKPRADANVLQPPVLTRMADPEFSQEARAQKFQGIVLVTMIVTSKGTVEDVWVVRGVGMGLDQNAAAAVRRYQFKPATFKGRPVGVELNVEVNFQIM